MIFLTARVALGSAFNDRLNKGTDLNLDSDANTQTAASLQSKLNRVRVVLVRTQLARNIGSAARAVKNMGLSQLWLVAPMQFPHAEANSLAAGADDLLSAAHVVPTLPEALVGCVAVYGTSARRRSIELPALTPDIAAAAAVNLSVAADADVALVFGGERVGLENDELSLCQARIEIPSNPEFSSLNLAQAVQICSYEVRRAALAIDVSTANSTANALADRRAIPASADEFEHFFEHYTRMLSKIEFFGSKAPEKVLTRLRRLFQRAEPDSRELQIMRGILTETEQRLGR